MELQLTHDVFADAVREVQAAAADLFEQRTHAATRVGDLLSSGWAGEAADAFAAGWQEWEQGATDIIEGLVAMAGLLDATHRDLLAQDAGSQAALDRISARIVERLG